MNTTRRNKNIVPVKSRTVKSRVPSRNNAIKQIYNRDYYGKALLPTTNIIQYIDSTFNDYMIMKQQKSELNLPAASFEDFFMVDDILKKKETIADIDTQVNKQPNASLNKFLAYSLYYSEYKNWFNSPNKKMDISLLKNQSGKDLSRIGILLNNVKYNSPSGDDNIKTDHFNVTIMNILSKFSVIDFDLINKIDISMCQNILNFLIDLITLLIMKKLAPEKAIITKVEKNLSINLTKSQQNIIYNLKTKFYITKDGHVYNGAITCGEMDLTFVIDLKKNSYKFSRFKCKYNAETCYQEEELGSLQSNVPNQDNTVENVTPNEENQGNSFLKYAIPGGLGVGVIATPFLLGALGGKNKKRKRKNKTRNKRRKRKNKTMNKKYFYR